MTQTSANQKPISSSGVLRPFPQHIQCAPGSILPNHRSQTQLDDDARTFYDYWKQNYLIEVGKTNDGNPIYRVAFGSQSPNRERTVSEGQGYGMMITALMAGHDPEAQTVFDGLWDFCRLYPSHTDARLMTWHVPENPAGNDSAFDGDADMAYGLLLAGEQWGNQGRVHYKNEAQTMITAIRESAIGPDSLMPMLGDWTDPNGQNYSQYTPRPSDFMPVNFRAYGKATNDPLWDKVIRKCHTVMQIIQEKHSPQTGLMPDFIVMRGKERIPEPSPAKFLESQNDGNYYYNAGRIPWRIGTDAILNNDPNSRAIAQKISRWAEQVTGGSPTKFCAGYQLDGTPLLGSDHFTSFFVAPLGVAAMSNPAQQDWLNTIYDSVCTRRENYYEDSVTLFCLLAMSGNAWTL